MGFDETTARATSAVVSVRELNPEKVPITLRRIETSHTRYRTQKGGFCLRCLYSSYFDLLTLLAYSTSCPREWLWTSIDVRKNAIEQLIKVWDSWFTKCFLSPTPTQLRKWFLDQSGVWVHIQSSQFDFYSGWSSSRFFLISHFFASNSYRNETSKSTTLVIEQRP